jgi:hypothetical protein
VHTSAAFFPRQSPCGHASAVEALIDVNRRRLERLAGAVEERRARNRATLQAGGSGLNRDTSEISAAGESLRGCAGQ